MLYFAFIGAAVLGFIIWSIFDCEIDALAVIGLIVGIISTGIAIIATFVLIFTYVGIPGHLASKREEYKALKYKLESPAARDEFGLVNKDIIEDITDWNETIVSCKANQKDFWIGIFIPNIYDEFETIEFPEEG